MFTKNGRALTAKGVKPIYLFQQVFKSTYLYQLHLFYNPSSCSRYPAKTATQTESIGLLNICIWYYLERFLQLINAKRFLLELPFCNNDTFQIYLNEFSEQDPDEFKVIVLDNGAFHKSKALKIPNNICLIFLPPYSPELNPAERIWEIIKANFTGLLFKNLELLSDFIKIQVNQLTEKVVILACSYSYIFETLN